MLKVLLIPLRGEVGAAITENMSVVECDYLSNDITYNDEDCV